MVSDDRDPVHRRRALQARSGVHDVAGDEPFSLLGAGTQGDDGLAGVDADPHLEGERSVLVVQVLDRLEDAECGANGALGVVLVRDRRAEDGHHRVADELLDGAAVALDLLPQASVVGTDPRADVLRVGRIRGRREADEVAEQHRDDLALLVGGAAGCAVSGAAQNGQNGKFPGSSLPHEGQVGTRGV